MSSICAGSGNGKGQVKQSGCSGFLPGLLACCMACLPFPVFAEWLNETRTLMGTEVSVELWSADRDQGIQAIEQAFAEVKRLDEMMNPWNPDSELARVNREAARGAVTTSPEIMRVVARSLYYSQLSEGAFDISFAAVGQYYDFRQGRSPSKTELASGRANIDYRAITLDPALSTIAYAKDGMAIDLGGIAKGYAVDRAIDILKAAGVSSAVVAAGGDSRIIGDLGDRPRTIGIRHPRREGEHIVMIPLADTAISTSGDYERYFQREGVRYHHILNPVTGDSARGLQSVSVLADKAIDSDALSTTVFVLGVEQGLALINRLDGVDAILIDGEGRLHYSAELLLSTTQ